MASGLTAERRWDIVFSSLGDTPQWVVLTAKFGLNRLLQDDSGGERSPNQPLKNELVPLVKRKQVNALVGDFYGCINLRIMASQRDSGR